jgi:hypothetical protein
LGHTGTPAGLRSSPLCEGAAIQSFGRALAIAVKDAARPPRESRSRAPRGLPEPRNRYLADSKLR